MIHLHQQWLKQIGRAIFPEAFISPSLNCARRYMEGIHACCSAPGSQQPRYSPAHHSVFDKSSPLLLLLADVLALLSQLS